MPPVTPAATARDPWSDQAQPPVAPDEEEISSSPPEDDRDDATPAAVAPPDVVATLRLPDEPREPADPDPPDIDEDDEGLVAATLEATTCTIAIWHGYRRATFYAQAFDSRGAEVAIAESPFFRYRGNGTPERTAAAAEAHRALVEMMREAGWEPTHNGASWFDLTLTRG